MSGNHSTTQHTVFLKTFKYVGCTGDGFTFGRHLEAIQCTVCTVYFGCARIQVQFGLHIWDTLKVLSFSTRGESR